ncbi:hypothetical protein [Roseibium sp.]|uniref:hypothetical protein n=1 Tax=Roseibium sp. TaxID=1936156 RepID=UPI003B529B7C
MSFLAFAVRRQVSLPRSHPGLDPVKQNYNKREKNWLCITVRDFGVDLEDALSISESVEI